VIIKGGQNDMGLYSKLNKDHVSPNNTRKICSKETTLGERAFADKK